MTTTWATRLATDAHELRLYFTIEGVPYVFQDGATDIPTTLEAATRPRLRLVQKIEQGESRLNMQAARQEGGGLTIDLQDDDDGTLASLFSPRRFRRTFLTADATAAAASISVKATAWEASYGIVADTLYIGAESITYAGTSGGNTFTGCTRGVWGSETQKHYGAATDGDGVYFTPPSWYGRRVTLYGYFLNKDGTTSSDLRTTLGVFRLESAPSAAGDDVWSLQCSELSDEFASRKICAGVVDVKPDGPGFEDNVTLGTFKVEVGTDERFDQFTQSATLPTYVLAKKDSGFALRPIAAVSSPNVIVYATGDSQMVSPSAPGRDIESMRHVALLTDPRKDVLRVITSRTGDVTNGSYDELPGKDKVSVNGTEWRFGAGVRSSEVDDTSFTTITTSSDGWSYPLVEEEDLGSFLSDWCMRFGAFWYVSRSGQLTVKTLAEHSGASSFTVDDGIINADKAVEVRYDEESITPRLALQCNFDPLARKFMTTLNVTDTQLAARYRNRDDRQSMSSRSIVIGSTTTTENGQEVIGKRPTIERGMVESIVGRKLGASGRGRLYVSCVCHLPILAVQLGDLVTLTAQAPNIEGSTTISGRLCRVVSMRPRYDDAEVDCTFEVIEKVFRIAPAATISSATGAVMTLNSYSSVYPEAAESGGATPGEMFRAADWVVVVWDVDLGNNESFNIISIAGANVTLSGAPSFTVQDNVDFLTLEQYGQGSGVSANGFSYTDFVFTVEDDESIYEDAGLEVTRWR